MPKRTKDEAAEDKAGKQAAHALRQIGRSDPEMVLADVVAVMDMDTQRLKEKALRNEPLTSTESQALGNYGRVLSQWVSEKRRIEREEKDLDKLSDDEIEAQAARIEAKAATAS